MNYAEARDLIEDGDLISVRGHHGILSAMTEFFTRSPYTHSGVAVWLDGGLWMAELNGGRNHAIPMSQLAGVDFDVSEPLVPDRRAIRQSLLETMRVVVPYGYAAFVLIGFLNFFKIQIFVHWRKILVCSGYCVAIYEGAGLPETTRILSPHDLFKMSKFKFAVRK